MNIPYYLEMYSRKFGEKVALKTEESTFTYEQLNEMVNKLATSLQKEGIGENSKVVLYLPNGFAFVVSYFSILKLGGIVVPVNTKLTATEINYIYKDSNASAIIADDDLFAVAKEVNVDGIRLKTGAADGEWLSLDDLITNGEPLTYESTMNEETICTILYTSGTTGDPKGVVLNNRNVLAVAQMICIEMEMNEDTTSLIMMPMSHSAPLNLFFVSTLLVGGTVVTRKDFHPLELLKAVEQEKTTHFFGAPVAYLFAAKLLENHSFDLSSMEWWVYGGAPISANEVLYIQKQFQTDRLAGVYGLTEGGPSGSLLLPEEHKEKVGSIGKRASLFTEIKIADADGNEVGPDEVGEIYIKGLGVMVEYYNKPEQTAETFKDGWIRTGDLAKYDEDGYIWVVDRAKDVIISGGVNIYPFEIEQKMLAHPAIAEAAVIGVPHREWGETVKAYYVSEEKIEEETLKEFLRKELASYKVPRIFERLEQLPRNATGKVLKHILRGKDKVK